MSDIVLQEQASLVGLNGVLLGELYGDLLKLSAAVAREDRDGVAEVLDLLREDVEALAAGMVFCGARAKSRHDGVLRRPAAPGS